MTLSFDLPNQGGNRLSQDDFKGKGLVLFFYPKAMTSGCTMEACDFRDNYDAFGAAGYNVVGVSPDPPALNAKFREKEGLNFDLLSDEDKKLAKALGAWGEKSSYGKKTTGLIRSTFVFDEAGEMVNEYRNVKATGHVARVAKDLIDAS